MLKAQLTDWLLVVLMWVGLLFGAWLMWRGKGFGLLLGMCLAVLVEMLRYRLDSLFLNYEERHVSGLTLHPDTLTLTHSTGENEVLLLSQLSAVRIVTNDSGPFGNDLYFVLEGDWGTRAIPGDLDDCKQLFGLFDCLPNFDHQQSLAAMGSTSNAVFDVWHAPNEGATT